MIKRQHIIKIRVSDSELSELRERSSGPLAVWLRECGLAQHKRKPVPQVDPNFLRQLVGIGNNLNQIARYLNSARPASARAAAGALLTLANEVAALRDSHHS